MLRSHGRVLGFALALLVWAGSPAHAQQQDLSSEMAALVGQNVDLRANASLRSQLLAHGLIAADAFTLHVTPELVQQVFSVESFYNQVNVTRYHVGDRILIEDDGSGGSISNRAEIKSILPDGRYEVTIWDKPEALTHPTTNGHVDVFSGKPEAGYQETNTKILVHQADGSTKQEWSLTPWLVRDNERTEVLTHDQIEKLNGVVNPQGSYRVNGWQIDPSTDPVLADRIAKAKESVDKYLPASLLSLPEDPKARAKQLDKISKAQEKLLNQIFHDNFIEHPGNEPAASARMRDYLTQHPDMRGKVGAVLASQCGVCTDQAAAMAAILNAIGPRAGLSALAIGGPTIGQNAGHGFVSIKFANGELGMYDVTWHFEDEKKAVDNLDFATYDQRDDSNRRINWTSEETTDKTAFVDRTTERARDLYRGYDAKAGEALLAGLAKERAVRDGISVADAAAKVVAENEAKGNERVVGSFTAADVASHAASLQGPSLGLTGSLDKMASDRDASKDHPADR